ncbi:MAG: calcium/sodium antiporter [Cyanobacteriota bacterium]|nr:calcium/sodium antiporter [Cyanobacteriota bacterium]
MPEFLRASVEVLIGIGLLFLGGDQFVRGSVTVALLCGIPQLVIGLTVVAFGTSAPELFVSLSSVVQGTDALAVSNVVGSNIFNILVVLGCCALARPLVVENRLVRRDVPVLLAISAAAWGMGSAGRMTWQAGVALLLGLIINTVWEVRTAVEDASHPTDASSASTDPTGDKPKKKGRSLLIAMVQLAIGLTLLVVGSKVLVTGAVTAATLLRVSPEVIGLTIVATGTSTPELITSLVATLKGKTDLAVGNVVGSCLLNLLMVLGGSAVISGSPGLQVSGELISEDLPMLMITTLVCLPIFWSRRRITRGEGAVLLCLYVLFLTDNVLPRTMLASWQDEFRLVALCLVIPVIIVVITIQAVGYWNGIRRRAGHIRE